MSSYLPSGSSNTLKMEEGARDNALLPPLDYSYPKTRKTARQTDTHRHTRVQNKKRRSEKKKKLGCKLGGCKGGLTRTKGKETVARATRQVSLLNNNPPLCVEVGGSEPTMEQKKKKASQEPALSVRFSSSVKFFNPSRNCCTATVLCCDNIWQKLKHHFL